MTEKQARPPSILVVDDEPALRSALAFDFELRDFRVLQAENGRRALDALESDRDIDIILTDVLMPVMSGVELLAQARSLTSLRQPGFVFLTGYSELTLEDALDRGAEAFFGKPFDRSTLIATVDRLLLPPRERWKQPPSRSARRPLHRIEGSVSGSESPNGSISLGRGGFFVSADLAPGLFLKQELEFQISVGSTVLEGTGRVAWVRGSTKTTELPAGAGVEWLGLTDPSLDALFNRLGTERLRSYVPKR